MRIAHKFYRNKLPSSDADGYRTFRVGGGVSLLCGCGCAGKRDLRATLKPQSPFVGYLSDLTRTREELLAENAVLRHQLVVLRRQVSKHGAALAPRGLSSLLALAVTAAALTNFAP
jgi:hypothetical protein